MCFQWACPCYQEEVYSFPGMGRYRTCQGTEFHEFVTSGRRLSAVSQEHCNDFLCVLRIDFGITSFEKLTEGVVAQVVPDFCVCATFKQSSHALFIQSTDCQHQRCQGARSILATRILL